MPSRAQMSRLRLRREEGAAYIVGHEDQHQEERDKDRGAIKTGTEHARKRWDGRAVRYAGR